MANISHFTQTVNGISTTYDIHDANAVPLSGSNQISGDLIPSSDGTVNLGSSSKKFASLNGIAPDELGLPTSTYTDVASYITHFDGTANTFTAPASGLLFIQGNAGDSIMGALFNDTKDCHVNCPWAYNNVRGFIPVEKGDSIECYLSAPINSLQLRIYHLKGKV